MKNNSVFKIGFISLILFIGIAAYLWYLYFDHYEGENLKNNVGLEFTNNGSIDYVNATPEDDNSLIPTYYFSVKNHLNETYNYEIKLEKNITNDMFADNELKYELRLNNNVIKQGLLSNLSNGLLDDNHIDGNSTNNYALRIWLKDELIDYANKEYHYKVVFKEK